MGNGTEKKLKSEKVKGEREKGKGIKKIWTTVVKFEMRLHYLESSMKAFSFTLRSVPARCQELG